MEAFLGSELLYDSWFKLWKHSTLHNLSKFSRIFWKRTHIWKAALTMMAEAGHIILFLINNLFVSFYYIFKVKNRKQKKIFNSVSKTSVLLRSFIWSCASNSFTYFCLFVCFFHTKPLEVSDWVRFFLVLPHIKR